MGRLLPVTQVGKYLGAGDPVDPQAAGGLEATHSLLGARAIATIDRSGCETRPGQATLQHAYTS